jgi:hypothetical protein
MPHLGFARATIAEAETSAITALGGPPDIVLALHACDTATDEALALAIRLGTPAILCVPCCQHELAAQLAANKSDAILEALTLTADPPSQTAATSTARPTQVFGAGPGPLPAGIPSPPSAPPVPALLRHGLLRGAYADLLTDSLRVEILEACGYDVAVVEFIASEHTAKNLLLRAHRRHPNARLDPSRWQLAPISARCAQLGVHPDLLRRLTAR